MNLGKESISYTRYEILNYKGKDGYIWLYYLNLKLLVNRKYQRKSEKADHSGKKYLHQK